MGITLLMAGCHEKARPLAVELHPVLGERLMIVPKGSKVGEHTTTEHGVFMTEEVLAGMMAGVCEECKRLAEGPFY